MTPKHSRKNVQHTTLYCWYGLPDSDFSEEQRVNIRRRKTQTCLETFLFNPDRIFKDYYWEVLLFCTGDSSRSCLPTYLKLTRSMGMISSMNPKYLDLTLLKVRELMQMDVTEEEVQVCTLLDKYRARFRWEAQENTSNTLIPSCLSSYVMIRISTRFHLETPEAQHTKIQAGLYDFNL